MKIWRICNYIWTLIFVIAVVWIMFRSVDGSGVTQTMSLRILNLLTVLAALIVVVLCQLMIRHFLRKKQL